MAADVTETATFELTPQQVFDFVVDFSNLSRWDPMFDRSTRLDDGELGVGSTFEVVADKAGKELPITYRIEQYDRPRSARLVGEGDGFTSIDEITVEAVGGGAELTWNARVETDAPVVDTLATPVFKTVAKASISGLRDELGS